MFHVKICGVCHQGDLPAIAAAGADAVGLNFYPQSKRFLSEREADEVAAAVPSDLARVGVFVNASGAAMLAAAQRFQLDYLQLHGDEPPGQLAELRSLAGDQGLSLWDRGVATDRIVPFGLQATRCGCRWRCSSMRRQQTTNSAARAEPLIGLHCPIGARTSICR